MLKTVTKEYFLKIKKKKRKKKERKCLKRAHYLRNSTKNDQYTKLHPRSIVMLHTYNPSTWKAEAGGSQVPSQPWQC
jgi:hypothetical protein